MANNNVDNESGYDYKIFDRGNGVCQIDKGEYLLIYPYETSEHDNFSEGDDDAFLPSSLTTISEGEDEVEDEQKEYYQYEVLKDADNLKHFEQRYSSGSSSYTIEIPSHNSFRYFKSNSEKMIDANSEDFISAAFMAKGDGTCYKRDYGLILRYNAPENDELSDEDDETKLTNNTNPVNTFSYKMLQLRIKQRRENYLRHKKSNSWSYSPTKFNSRLNRSHSIDESKHNASGIDQNDEFVSDNDSENDNFEKNDMVSLRPYLLSSSINEDSESTTSYSNDEDGCGNLTDINKLDHPNDLAYKMRILHFRRTPSECSTYTVPHRAYITIDSPKHVNVAYVDLSPQPLKDFKYFHPRAEEEEYEIVEEIKTEVTEDITYVGKDKYPLNLLRCCHLRLKR